MRVLHGDDSCKLLFKFAKQGQKFRSYFGHEFMDCKCFMLDKNGPDLLIIEEKIETVYIAGQSAQVDAHKATLVLYHRPESHLYSYQAIGTEVQKDKCLVLDWINFWDTHSKQYWLDKVWEMRESVKNRYNDYEYSKHWSQFFHTLALILEDRSNAWQPKLIIDGIKIYD